MGVYFGTTEVTNVDWIPGNKDITQVFFATNEVFTVWGEYDGTLPAQYSANGSALADYRIYGSAGRTGDRTVNLLDGNLITNENPGTTWSKITYNLKPNTSYVLCTSVPRYGGGALLAIIGNSGSATTANNGAWDGNPRVWETDSTGVVNVLFRGNNSGYDLTQYDYMLTEGSTAPAEYVPYGYEVDMSVSDGTTSTTTPIYIGADPLGEDEYVDYTTQKIYRKNSTNYVDINNLLKGYYEENEYQDVNYRVTTPIIPFAGECKIHIKMAKNFNYVKIDCFDQNQVYINRGSFQWIFTQTKEQTVTRSEHSPTPANTAFVRINVGEWNESGTVSYLVSDVEIFELFDTKMISEDPPVPLPALPTVDGTTITDYAGQSAAVPSRFVAKYRKEGF